METIKHSDTIWENVSKSLRECRYDIPWNNKQK